MVLIVGAANYCTHFTAYGVNQPYFQQFDVGREQVNALAVVQDTFLNIYGIVLNDVLHDGRERDG